MKFELQNPLRGIGAIGLFAVIVAATLGSEFPGGGTPESAGFPGGESITWGLGRAMFNLGGADWYGEGFLAAFEIIDVVLVAALVAAVMLARRDVGGRIAGALRIGGEDE